MDAPIGDGVRVVLDVPHSDEHSHRHGRGEGAQGGIRALAVGYHPLKDHVEKSTAILEQGSPPCGVCQHALDGRAGMVVTCPHKGCQFTSHLTCLSQHFLANDASKESVLPVLGRCPGCDAETRWIDWVQELTLRTRGASHLQKLLRPVRQKRLTKTSRDSATEQSDGEDAASDANEGLGEDWRYLEEYGEDDLVGVDRVDRVDGAEGDDDDDDDLSVTSASSLDTHRPGRAPNLSGRERQRLEVVIEDTDWDDAEVLD